MTDNYGYVNFNKTFLLTNFVKIKLCNIINISNGKIEEYSPIECFEKECQYALSSNNLPIILNKNDEPVFSLSSQNEISKFIPIQLI
ncbi:hypothetical protein MHK_007099, partial [Candidatus Magnetomorum sp. HK-1]